MVKLRLRRKGRKYHAIYDIIAVDGRKKRDGAYLERIGYFDPNHSPSFIQVDPHRAIYWLNVGAQPTDIVKRILSYEGVLLRRHLQFKGKTQEEIEESVEKHKKYSYDRYFKMKDHRKQKKIDKEKAAAEAEKAKAEQEAAAKAAEEAAKAEQPAEA
jgi:small subunit ribosomal protein S16